MCEDRLWVKRRSFHEWNLINKLKISMIMYNFSLGIKTFVTEFGSTNLFGRALPIWVDSRDYEVREHIPVPNDSFFNLF